MARISDANHKEQELVCFDKSADGNSRPLRVIANAARGLHLLM